MSEGGLVYERIRVYVEALSPKARAMLVRAARNASREDSNYIPPDMLLRAVDGLDIDGEDISGLRPPPAPKLTIEPLPLPQEMVSRRERIDEQLWAPLAPFLVDVVGPTKQMGRIARASLDSIVTWLHRDVAAAEFAVAYAGGDDDSPRGIAATADRLRLSLVNRILGVVRQAEGDPKEWQRIVGQVGNDRTMTDLRDMLEVIQNAAAISQLFSRIPKLVTVHDLDEGSTFATRMEDCVTTLGVEVGHVGAAVLSRTNHPHLLALLAMRIAATEDARAIAQNRCGGLVDFLFQEIERMVAMARQLEADRKQRDRVPVVIRDYHEALRQTLLIIETDDVGAWRKTVGAIRKDMSDLVGRHVDNAAGLMRRALRVESLAGGFGAGFDPDALEDAIFAVKLYNEARAGHESLALNEILARAKKDIERTAELLTEKLLSDLRAKGSFDRHSLISAVDGAIALCRLVFGEDYANLRQKARDLALKPKDRAAG